MVRMRGRKGPHVELANRIVSRCCSPTTEGSAQRLSAVAQSSKKAARRLKDGIIQPWPVSILRAAEVNYEQTSGHFLDADAGSSVQQACQRGQQDRDRSLGF